MSFIIVSVSVTFIAEARNRRDNKSIQSNLRSPPL